MEVVVRGLGRLGVKWGEEGKGKMVWRCECCSRNCCSSKTFLSSQKPEKIQLIPHMPKNPFLSLPKNNNPFIPIVPPPPPPPPTNNPPPLPPPFLSFSSQSSHTPILHHHTST